jgi:hypothetical protein
MTKAIYFDLDSTLADLYAVEGWLPMLRAYDPTPYANAEPMVRMASLARVLNRLRNEGYTIGIVSWLSKEPTPAYDMAVTQAKLEWLSVHLPSVQFDEIHIVAHGIPKWSVVEHMDGILFDDEEKNRQEWKGVAYDVQNIIEVLRGL